MAEEKRQSSTQNASEPESVKPNAQQNQATDNGFSQLLESVKPLAEMYMNYMKQQSEAKMKEADARIKYFQHASKHNRNVLYAMTAFLIGVIAFMSLLTWTDKVSGDALLFLVGTVVGYLILFIQKLAHPTDEHPIEEVD
jgi:ABC-type transport system involved in cytochrome bd biosynthesis fused ATPase/permease subunit